MNAPDLILEWLGEVGDATPARLSRALAGIEPRFRPGHVPGWVWRRSVVERLVRAGHAERDATGRLRAVPPTFVTTAADAGHFFGARCAAFLRALRGRGVPVRVSVRGPGPAVWRVEGAAAAAGRIAEAGAAVVADRGAELLASLPPLDAVLGAAAACTPPPAGSWRVLDVSAAGLRWTRAEGPPPGGPALFAEGGVRPARWYWAGGDGGVRLLTGGAERDAAAWAAARSAAGFTFSAEAGTLALASPLRPPALVERALAAAGGGPPVARRSVRLYPGVDRGRAAEVARILGLDAGPVRPRR